MNIGFVIYGSVDTLSGGYLYDRKLVEYLRAQGDTVEIRIRDNGDGIPQAVREKIFNPFFTTKPPGRAAPAEVQQCYRVASGPAFVLIVFVPDMASYHAFAHRVLTTQANVRNVRGFFAVKRSKFEPVIPL